MSDMGRDANDFLDEIIAKMREVCRDKDACHTEYVSVVDPNTVFDVNSMTRCVKDLFQGQDVRIDFTYGDGARAHGNVQVYTKDAILIGDQCAALAQLIRQCSSVNFTVMKSNDVMMQMWPNNDKKG